MKAAPSSSPATAARAVLSAHLDAVDTVFAARPDLEQIRTVWWSATCAHLIDLTAGPQQRTELLADLAHAYTPWSGAPLAAALAPLTPGTPGWPFNVTVDRAELGRRRRGPGTPIRSVDELAGALAGLIAAHPHVDEIDLACQTDPGSRGRAPWKLEVREVRARHERGVAALEQLHGTLEQLTTGRWPLPRAGAPGRLSVLTCSRGGLRQWWA